MKKRTLPALVSYEIGRSWICNEIHRRPLALPGPDGSHEEFHQAFKKTEILHILFQETEEQGYFWINFYEHNVTPISKPDGGIPKRKENATAQHPSRM